MDSQFLRPSDKTPVKGRHQELQRGPFQINGNGKAPQQKQQSGQLVFDSVEIPSETPRIFGFVEGKPVGNRPPLARTEEVHDEMQMDQA